MTTERALAPWQLKGRCWTFLLPGLSDGASFPAGFAHESNAQSLSECGQFIGGFGSVQVYSYGESPVGPYDELIYTIGRFRYKDGSKAHRITRIYVSSEASVYNGRLNWNIPKEKAKFSIVDKADGSTAITVSAPSSDTVFFRASFKPLPLPAFPFSSKATLSYLQLIQPPLEKAEKEEEAATDTWKGLLPVFNGSCRLVKLAPGDRSLGDGQHFPRVDPYTVGTYLSSMSLQFGEPKVFEDQP